jgi:hypothetical protein
LPWRLFHSFHGVGRNAYSAIAPGETVILPNHIDFVILGKNRGEFAIGLHHEPEGFQFDREFT